MSFLIALYLGLYFSILNESKECLMRVSFIFLLLLLVGSKAHAFQWSSAEFVEKCSVVHHKILDIEDQATANYCIGVLRGAFTGILFTGAIKDGRFREAAEGGTFELPQCLLATDDGKFWTLLKDVVAQMRINNRDSKVESEPNTATSALIMALIQLYPCLLDPGLNNHLDGEGS